MSTAKGSLLLLMRLQAKPATGGEWKGSTISGPRPGEDCTLEHIVRTLLLLAALSLMGVPASAAEGTVVYRISGCDYFVVFTPNGYDVLEWYGGWNPHKG